MISDNVTDKANCKDGQVDKLSKCCYNHYLSGAGVCIPCHDGTYGLNCSEACQRGYYGNLCKSVCACTVSQICTPARGCITVGTEPGQDEVPLSQPILVVLAIICLVLIAATIVWHREKLKCIGKITLHTRKKAGNMGGNDYADGPQSAPEEEDTIEICYDDVRESRMVSDSCTLGTISSTDHRFTMINHLWDNDYASNNEAIYDTASLESYERIRFSNDSALRQCQTDLHDDDENSHYGRLDV